VRRNWLEQLIFVLEFLLPIEAVTYGLETTGKSRPGAVRIRRRLRRKTKNSPNMPQMWGDRHATLSSATLGKTFVQVYCAVPLSRVWRSILEDTFRSAPEMTRSNVARSELVLLECAQHAGPIFKIKLDPT
jgi:hypothetical protein